MQAIWWCLILCFRPYKDPKFWSACTCMKCLYLETLSMGCWILFQEDSLGYRWKSIKKSSWNIKVVMSLDLKVMEMLVFEPSDVFPLNLDWISFRVPFEVKPSNFDGNELLSTFYCRFWVCRTSAWVHVRLYWCHSINWIPSTDSMAHLPLIFHGLDLWWFIRSVEDQG